MITSINRNLLLEDLDNIYNLISGFGPEITRPNLSSAILQGPVNIDDDGWEYILIDKICRLYTPQTVYECMEFAGESWNEHCQATNNTIIYPI